MSNFILEAIYTKQDERIPEYLVVIFETNQGLYQVGYGKVLRVKEIALNGFTKNKFLIDLKNKYGMLEIVEIRTTYDNDIYFLISNKFLLVLGFTLSSTTEHSISEFWLEEEIYGLNKSALNDFMEMDKIDMPT